VRYGARSRPESYEAEFPNLAPDPLAMHAAASPDRVAVVVAASGGAGPSTTTFAELNTTVNHLAQGLRALGAEAGDRLVWCGPNSLEVLVVIHAARKAGLTAVPLSYRFIADEMQYVVDNSDATIVIVDAEQAPLIAEVRDQLPKVRQFVVFGAGAEAFADGGFVTWDAVLAAGHDDEPESVSGNTAGAAMIYTSGTTGKPKGALRTSSDAGIVGAMLGILRLRPVEEVHLTTGPLYHSGPLAFALLSHTLGCEVVVLRKFDASAWLRLVREHRVTTTFSAPTQLKRIVNLPGGELAGADLSSMRCLIANAAPVPYALKQEFIARFGDGFLFEVYGSTELGVATILEPEDQLRKPGSCGRPYGGIGIKIVRDDGTEADVGEPGELFLSTGLAMDGYHRTAEQLGEHGGGEWKSVGDVAFLDDEGYLSICDRMKDMIISAGVNIYPAEIEAVIHEHPGIIDVAVFGIPDDEWGESVHAVVQPKAGVALDTDELREFVEARVARYKRPRGYELRAELPRTEAGKLLKRVLRDEYWQGRESAV
jgi:acyl-CoA synthetase (AMP-forming)/AMP-acid ligase II